MLVSLNDGDTFNIDDLIKTASTLNNVMKLSIDVDPVADEQVTFINYAIFLVEILYHLRIQITKQLEPETQTVLFLYLLCRRLISIMMEKSMLHLNILSSL